AEKCCLSTSYFGTLVKTEMGRTAKDIINDRILSRSKELLSNDTLTITQVSQKLGFEYPQHFVRFFKGLSGMTPSQWRAA
ncbi:MAG: helix-turn-helix transcriptional regulator, partial [Bacteroidales bacterium]|nr:helix-turn-helix transcriptional regulator [Bacteroidales bacterium]